MAREITPQEAEDLRERGAAIVDVRRPDEIAEGVIRGVRHIPLDQLPSRAEEIPPGAVVLVCRSGDRSAMGAEALQGAGYDAQSMAGGMLAWEAAGLPVERP